MNHQEQSAASVKKIERMRDEAAHQGASNGSCLSIIEQLSGHRGLRDGSDFEYHI